MEQTQADLISGVLLLAYDGQIVLRKIAFQYQESCNSHEGDWTSGGPCDPS